jgi:CubicO group peptidase (beta-lactamase class C family)
MAEVLYQFLNDSVPEGTSLGVVDGEKVLFAHGDRNRLYQVASVTKIFTALGVLMAAQKGLLDLNDEAGPNGAKLSHLLSHSSGLSFDDRNIILAPPGKRRIYSNVGMEIAAYHASQKIGQELKIFIEEQIFSPLEMKSSRLQDSYATGGLSTLDDLLRLGQELLRRQVLPTVVHEKISDVAYPGLIGVLPGFGRQDPCDFSLGAEIKGSKSPHWTGSGNSPATFGHFGQSGSFIWVDRQSGLSCIYLGTSPFGELHKQIWPKLSDIVLSVYNGSI